MEARRAALARLLQRLVDQEGASVLVEPMHRASGFWFGGGNVVEEAGALYLCGRYRNVGDSRFGVAKGERGLALALFRSDDGGKHWTRVQQWTKEELSACEPGVGQVLSIEGSALHRSSAAGEWELFVSSEKLRPYPASLAAYQKAGTGVWSIDRVSGAASIAALDPRASLAPVLACEDAGYLHVKDPVAFEAADGCTALLYCSHPFCWSSANTGLALQRDGEFCTTEQEFVRRGPNWDVAATRVTGRLQVPRLGLFADQPQATVFFYDGAECLRCLDENEGALRRPRGYSCEELGGAFVQWAPDAPLERLSQLRPLFVSPYGTGCSRYVDCARVGAAGGCAEGFLTSWQQAQEDGAQPLVGTFVALAEAEALLS